MRFLLISMLFPALVQEATDAETLYRKMEKQIADAKTLQVSLDVTAQLGDEKAVFKGRLAIDQGNKARLEFDGQIGGKGTQSSFVSDGNTTKVSPQFGSPKNHNTPAKLTDIVKVGVTRTGLFILAEKLDEPDPSPLLAVYAVSNFKLGAQEKLGQRQAQMLTYTLTRIDVNLKESATVTLYLDAKTSLPLKRVLKADQSDKIVITEAYRDLRLDEKVDAKLFELPK